MSGRRLQVVLSEEAWAAVESVLKQASQGFDSGSIHYSDVVNEMILNSKIDVKTLQLKNTDFRRQMRVMASQKNIDIDAAIRTLNEIKTKLGKRTPKAQLTLEEPKDA